MPSRSSHEKSRHGCWNCKQKRKRCDLQKPSCGRCVATRVTCTSEPWPQQYALARQSVTFTNPLTPLTFWSSLSPIVRSITTLQIPHVEANDLELVEYYNVKASGSFLSMPGLAGIAKLRLVEKAEEYPYLLYGLLAASAWHIRSVSKNLSAPQKLYYLSKAIKFQQFALTSYLSRLRSINEKTCSSIFAFSIMLTGLELSSQSLTDDAERPNLGDRAKATNYLENFVRIIELLHGSIAVAKMASDWIPSLPDRPWSIPIKSALQYNNKSLSPGMQQTLDYMLFHLLQETAGKSKDQVGCNDQRVTTLRTAVFELYNLFRCHEAGGFAKFQSVIAWPASVSRSYVSQLTNHDPGALVVLAHYAVALHALGDIWWLSGTGRAVVSAVLTIIRSEHGPTWDYLLEWPLSKVELGTAIYAHRERSSETALVPTLTLEPRPFGPFETALAYTYAQPLLERDL